MPDHERVVLLDERGAGIGTAAKADVHHGNTPLHLAFSCYLFNDAGELLVTRRALSKKTWPGVWTNSFCGHPAPGEEWEGAVRRRAHQELGADVSQLRLALPDFRYRATDAGGTVENEVCPVFTARLDGGLDPSPDEVVAWEWVHPLALADAVSQTPFAFSPWLVLQLPLLDRAGLLETVVHA